MLIEMVVKLEHEHNDIDLEEFEEGNKELEEHLAKNKEEALVLLKKLFKPLYGDRWSKEQDEDVELLLKSITDMAVCESLIDVRLAFLNYGEDE